jgi:hypothetical protein
VVALADGQAEIRADTSAALLIGDDTDFMWVREGPHWWGAPEIRTTDIPRSGADGSTLGRDLLGKHVTTLQVTILGDDESDVGDKIDAWKAACAHTPEGLIAVRANLLGRTRVRYGRFRIPGEADAALARNGYVAIGSAQFEVLDSRTYGDTAHTAVTGRVQEGSGFTPPFTPPFTLGASVGGTVDAFNAGNTTAPWTARLDGPLTYPTVTHLESGQRLSLALTANGGIDLAAGQWIDLDSTNRSVLLNGTADRRTQLTIDSTWWELAPGSNTFELSADTGTGTLTVSWRDVYVS